MNSKCASLTAAWSEPGYIAVLMTPFSSSGEIDRDAVRANLGRLERLSAVRGVYVGSVYQQFTALTLTERFWLAEAAVAWAVKHGYETVVAASANALPEARALAEHASDIGATATMVWPPLFGERTPDAVTDFVEAVCETRPEQPVCIYSSGLDEVGFHIKPPQLQEILERCANVVAVKEASLTLGGYLAMLRTCGDQVAVSSPLEEYHLVGKLLEPGIAPGVLLGSSRVLYADVYCDHPCERYVAAVREADWEEAWTAAKEILDLAEAVHNPFLARGGHSLAAARELFREAGFDIGAARPPLRDLPPSKAEELRQAAIRSQPARVGG